MQLSEYLRDNKFILSPTISYRTYSTEKNDISIVSNENTHKYIVLESVSSKLFDFIIKGIEINTIIQFCKEYEIEDEFEGFLQELYEEGIILSKKQSNNKFKIHCISSKYCADEEINDDEELLNDIVRWTNKHNYLWSAHLDLTYKCNAKCIHCYNPNSQNREKNEYKNELTFEEVTRLIDGLAKIGVFKVTLSGGEVTLRNDFWDILGYCRRKGFCVEIYSNGINFDEEFIDKLLNYYVNKVSFSVYSYDANKHDNITKVNGSHKKVVDAINQLNNKGIMTEFKSVQLNSTFNDYFKTKEFGESLNCNVIMDLSLTCCIDGDKSPLKYGIPYSKLVDFALKPGTEFSIIDNNFISKKIDINTYPCGAGRSSLAVDPYGNVYPCTSFPLKLGNIRENPIEDIWNQSIVLKKWKEVKIKDFNQCGKLEYCKYCGEICAAEAYLEKGDYLETSSNNCKKAKARMEAHNKIMFKPQ